MIGFEIGEIVNHAAVSIADILTFTVSCAVRHIYSEFCFSISKMIVFQFSAVNGSV